MCRSIDAEDLKVVSMTFRAFAGHRVDDLVAIVGKNRNNWELEQEIFSSAATFRDRDLGTCRLFFSGSMMVFAKTVKNASLLVDLVKSRIDAS